MAPIRTCVGCRQRCEQAELARLVWDPSADRVEFDPPRRIAGRGAWVHPEGDCLSRALAKRALTRALRRPVGVESVAHLTV